MDNRSLPDPRWVQRFENFGRAFVRLRSGIERLQNRYFKLFDDLYDMLLAERVKLLDA